LTSGKPKAASTGDRLITSQERSEGTLMKTTQADSRREGGQTLLIFVLALTVLLGMTAMAIDVGLLFEDRRHMQNTADAAAQVGSISDTRKLMHLAMVLGDSACLTPTGTPIVDTNCSVKVGSGLGTTGWYGALDLDGNGGGSSEYESNINDGMAQTVYCAQGQTEPECQTSTVDALEGNKTGGTGHGIDQRLAAEP